MVTIPDADAARYTANLNEIIAALAPSGDPPPSTSRKLATLPLTNTSAATQPPGHHTNLYRWWFPKGDIPAGTAPRFLVSGIAQPYSWGTQRYHDDGSLWGATFGFRTTFTFVAGAMQPTEVWDGGVPPQPSVRTLAEVYAQDNLKINVTGAGANFGLSGDWSAWAKDDINNVQQLVYLDGDAGKWWRLLTHFAQSQGGAKHGQLMAYQYVAALTDAAGGLGRFRHLGRIIQPLHDQDTPAKNWRAFTAASWQHGSTVVPIQWPFLPANFTWTSGYRYSGANNFYSGAGDGSQNIPVILSTTGMLPDKLTTDRLFFVKTIGSSPTVTEIWNSSDCNASAPIPINGGSGVHTMTPVMTCLHFGSPLYTADKDGRWNSFQGTGSMAADGTMRTQIDLGYFHKAKVLPPFDLSLVGQVADNPAYNHDWNPASFGPLNQYQGASGDQPGIGPWPRSAVRYLYNQTAASEKLLRIVGLAAGGDGFCFLDKTSYKPPNLSNMPYDGMNPPRPDLVWYGSSGGARGFTSPPSNNRTWPFSQTDWSHKPCYDVPAFVIFGEPQTYDTIMERGVGTVLSTPTNYRNVTLPYTAYGLVAAFADQTREMGWKIRDFMYAAGLCASDDLLAPYFEDMAAANTKHMVDIMSNINAYCKSAHLWMPLRVGTKALMMSSWQRSFVFHGLCVAVALRPHDTNAVAMLDEFIARNNYVLTKHGGYPLSNYYEHTGEGGSSGTDCWPPIDSDDKWGISVPNGAKVDFTAGTPGRLTITPAKGWILTVNDGFVWSSRSGAVRPAGVPTEVPTFAVDVTGNTCGLSLTRGGPLLAFTSSGVGAGPYVTLANPPLTNAPGDGANTSPIGYCASVRSNHQYAAALGRPNTEAVIADMTTRMSAGGVNVALDPRWAMQNSF